MDHQRLGIADVGEMRKYFQRLDETLAGGAVAVDGEGEYCAAAPGQEFFRQGVIGVLGQFGVGHRLDRGMLHQELDHLARVLDMALHPQRQGLDTLQYLKRGGGAHAGAEVTQPLAPRAQRERGDGGLLREIHAVEAFVLAADFRKLARSDPVEGAAVDEDAADGDAVPAEEFGGGMEQQIGAVIEGFQQIGRGKSRIDHQRQAMRVRDRRHRGNVEHVQPGVAQRLGKQRLRVGPDGGAPGVQIARLDEGGFDAEARQRVMQEIVRAAVERTGGDDVRAGAGDRREAEVQRCLATRGGDAGDPAFERRDSFLQHRVGRIGDARIHMACALHVEQRRGVIGIAEDEGSGEIDRRGARPGVRVGRLSGVQAERIKA